jgi:DNA-binding FrmR family transcriptional regulator
MADAPNPSKEDILKRLRRIEGQVRGVARMVEEDRDCREVIQQLAAIRAASHQVGQRLARSYACQCLAEPPEGAAREAMLDELMSVLSKAS